MDRRICKPLVNTPKKIFEIQKTVDERLLTKKEIADFLNVSVKMIDRKVILL